MVCHLWKIKHKLLPACTKIKHVNNTIEENKRTKKTNFKQDSAVITSKIVLFRKSVLFWNQIQNANSNINSSSLTYKTMKFKSKEYFLSVFREDPSMATYGKNLNLFDV